MGKAASEEDLSTIRERTAATPERDRHPDQTSRKAQHLKTMNYAEYMNAENAKAAHEQFYSEVAQEARVKVSDRLAEESRKALEAGDEHLNTIPLVRWDGLAWAWRHKVAATLKSKGTGYSIAQGVCTMKAAARKAAQGEG